MSESNNLQIVIGITGLKAGGKDELTRVLKGRGFNVRRISDAIRLECAERGLANPTVHELMNVGNWGREHSGDGGYWPKRLLAIMAAEGKPCVAINGIRNPGEVEVLRNMIGARFVLVGITAPTWLRYQRSMKRKQGGDPAELEGFLKMDDRDRGIGEPPDGQQVDRCLALCELENLYNNAGTMEEYEQWIAAFVQRQLATA